MQSAKGTYEEYFSEFDRFRISMITAPWQKQYGYPYVSSLNFSRCELCDMFSKKFRFQDKLAVYSDEENIELQNWYWGLVSNCLWMIRERKILERNNDKKSS